MVIEPDDDGSIEMDPEEFRNEARRANDLWEQFKLEHPDVAAALIEADPDGPT